MSTEAATAPASVNKAVSDGGNSAINRMELSAFEQRRLLRIAFSGAAGFAISKIMGWPFGVFFAVFPMFLIGMVPVFNSMIVAQFLAGTVVSGLELWILQQLFTPYPLLSLMVVAFFFCCHFRWMITTPYMLLWASSLVTTTTLLNLGSYQPASIHNMMVTTAVASVISVIAVAVTFWLIPEPESPGRPPVQNLSHSQINHRMLMGGLLCTGSYIVFQVCDLQDSLSAQVATVLVLFPMTLQGTLLSSWNRTRGILYGCGMAIVVQILMYDLIDHLILVVIAMFMTVLVAARLHLAERAGSARGFGALTTIGILFGQYMQPGGDILYSSIYRITSVTFALVLLMICAWSLDALLNRWSLTRNSA